MAQDFIQGFKEGGGGTMTHKPQIIRVVWGRAPQKYFFIFTFSETDSQVVKPFGVKLTLQL